jgi:hypothetical protein
MFLNTIAQQYPVALIYHFNVACDDTSDFSVTNSSLGDSSGVNDTSYFKTASEYHNHPNKVLAHLAGSFEHMQLYFEFMYHLN